MYGHPAFDFQKTDNAIRDLIKYDEELDFGEWTLPYNYKLILSFLLENPENTEGKIYNIYLKFAYYELLNDLVYSIAMYLEKNSLDKKSLKYLQEVIKKVYIETKLHEKNVKFDKKGFDKYINYLEKLDKVIDIKIENIKK